MELVIGQNLNIEQTQRLSLTQEMVQSLNILQFSAHELIDYIYDVMEENPVIDVECSDLYLQPAGVEDDSYEDNETETEYEYDWDADDWYNYAESENSGADDFYGRYTIDLQNQKNDRFAYAYSDGMTLEESLISQIDVSDEPYIIKAIAVYIIQTLDENGYMTDTIEEIATELNIKTDMALQALELVRTFDPPGIAASNLGESLELQLKAIGRMDDYLKKILDVHLENIAANRINIIAKDLGIKPAQVQEYADLLRSLEPKPGRIFSIEDKTKFIIPDVIMEGDYSNFSLHMNENAIPKVIIRKEYREMLRESEKNSVVASFLTTRFNSAKWLMDCIEQRNSTVLKVAQAIIDIQKKFFVKGKPALKVITMKEIAEKVGVHESTVSRAVNGKYLQSTQGVYELKYFFSGGSHFIGKNDSKISSESLRQMISKLIDGEDRTMPLSDKSIAEAIMVTGVEISRRTVAKYREEMGIPSSSVRRRVK